MRLSAQKRAEANKVDRCSCPESLALRAELTTVTAERDYLRGMASPDDLRVMRQELARGWLSESEQTDFTEVLGE